MFWTYLCSRCRPAFVIFMALAGSMPSAGLTASALSLAAAEDIALTADPTLKSVRANKSALDELSVAAAQLPDPMLKMGLVSLPMDTFNLGQEPMTQVQVGMIQKFPRGKSRALRSEQIEWKSEGLDEMARDQELQILLSVREQYLEVLKQEQLAKINAEAIAAFSDLADITQGYYATGRVAQQDVLQAAVELAKVEDRAIRIDQDEEQARARLALWIGEAAYGELLDSWPAFEPASAETIKALLQKHPRVEAFQKRILEAQTGVELARQKYKPEFALDVTYGGRGGTNPDGTSRTDLLTFMVVMDMPLFRKNRQDRMVASQIAESSAAMFTRDDIIRRMQSEIDFHAGAEKKQLQRIHQFESALLPEASFSAEASLGAYQSSIQDLTTLLRARITEFDLQLEYARLQAEVRKTQARLLYLEGEGK